MGRPVGVAFDATGALLVADDVGNAIWRVMSAPAAQAQAAPREARGFTITGVLAPSTRPPEAVSDAPSGLLPVAPRADATGVGEGAADASARAAGAAPATSGRAVGEPARTASSDPASR
jgi:hypothetical protein